MKVIAFNGSPRPEGNTHLAISTVLRELENVGIETELINVGNQRIRGCIACNWCARHGGERCVFKDDDVNAWIEKIRSADGIVLGSPVYFSGINGTMKSFLDRAGYVLAQTQGVLRGKVGAALIAVRRSGGVAALDQLNHYIHYFQMVAPSSNYWSVIHGMRPGEAVQDDEGVQIHRILGKNMAWLMKSLEYAREAVPMPDLEKKIATNFIR